MSRTGGAAPETMPLALAATLQRVAHHTAVVDDGQRCTYAELSTESERFGAALHRAGVGPGDRVALWAPNSARWIVAALGLLRAGAVLVPVNTRFKGAEAGAILARSRAQALVTVTEFLGTDYLALLESAQIDLPDLALRVVIDGPVPQGAVGWAEFLDSADDASRSALLDRARAVLPESPSDILFTSGTTGTPKGVVMTHGRTLRVATDWVAMTGLCSQDRYLMVNPYFHMFGLKAGILASVVAGATMLPEAVFDAERALARVEDERVSVLPGPPALYQALLDHPGRAGRDLSSLRIAVTGAADIPVELVRRVRDELPFSSIVTGYGLTEAGTAAATSPEDDPHTVATTVGRPRPGFEIRIADPAGGEVPPGRPGEVLLRGPSVMARYLDDAVATAEALSPEGWLATGDLGLVDPAGCLRIVGRSKDVFIVGGFNAYPAEIENALLGHPAVVRAAVIGVPDERLGEVGQAFVVTAPGSTVTPGEIIEWCRAQMANYKVPRRVELVPELPLGATGKVLKDVLRARGGGASVDGAARAT